ncbi:hypothetical protein, partial [Plasmodium yoelii yoelii]
INILYAFCTVLIY